jgi:hypothetical protein
MTTPRLPGPQNRIAVVGSTGTGKTVAGLWHLSNADILLRPWVILDFKRDPHIAKLAAQELTLTQTPKRPGLYVYRPIPERDDDAVRALLWRIWERENIGLFTDEGYMLGNRNPALNALLTQGRTKNIQMITLSQRPVWMSRFVFSESDFFQVFRLNDRRDYENIQAMCGLDITRRLPSYHSHYYDVGQDLGIELAPVPKVTDVLAKINAKLRANIGMI